MRVPAAAFGEPERRREKVFEKLGIRCQASGQSESQQHYRISY